MALPFYVVQATSAGIGAAEVAVLLGAQTAGALTSNPLWGWWGDRIGKRPLLEGVAALSVLAPSLALVWPAADAATPALIWFGIVFFVLGAVGNGGTIAQLGYLMEISPDDGRPAYSGYFNAIVAPAALSPLADAAFVKGVGRRRCSWPAPSLPAFNSSPSVVYVGWNWRRPGHDPADRLGHSPCDNALVVVLQAVVPTPWPPHRGPVGQVWYFAVGVNMHDSAIRERRQMRPLEWRPGCIKGYRLRFNLEGRPKGGAAPANIAPDPEAEVWGALYSITREDLLWLDYTEGVPGRRYRHLWSEAEDRQGNRMPCVTYIAEGNETDGRPSLRYITRRARAPAPTTFPNTGCGSSRT